MKETTPMDVASEVPTIEEPSNKPSPRNRNSAQANNQS